MPLIDFLLVKVLQQLYLNTSELTKKLTNLGGPRSQREEAPIDLKETTNNLTTRKIISILKEFGL